MNFKIEINTICFTVYFDWPEADVNAVYAEIGGMFQDTHKVKTNRTPVSACVEKVLNDIMMNCRAYWESMGVHCKAYNNLMMGQASVEFDTTLDKFSPELLKRVKTDCQRLMVAGVRYYKRKTPINGHRICSALTH